MLSADQLLTHFRIIRKLGEGGMGEVYLAEDQKLKRNVALKILQSDFLSDSEKLHRFQREATTAAQISHPNVMSIFDISSAKEPSGTQEISFIVMEYIKGEPLSDYLRIHASDIPLVVRLAEKIASGLAAAHKLQIVHRDIKADNILIDENGEPKILDFGLAKPIEVIQFGKQEVITETVDRELTHEGKILGTVSYMSPEQARGEPVDTRSDIFSFGILLYRMVTGELPFSGPDRVSTIAKVLEAKHSSPRLKNAGIPEELERIIDKCLQKDADDRYQDSRDLVVDLRNLRRQYDSGASETISSIADTARPSKSKTARRIEWKHVVLFAILAIAVISMAGFLFSGGGKPVSVAQAENNGLAIMDFENESGDPELDWLRTGIPEILLTDLAQSKTLNVISRRRISERMSESQGQKEGDLKHDEYVQAARNLGAVSVLTGSFYRLGSRFRIDTRLEDVATGKVIFAEKVVGDDPFALVDSLTSKIVVSFDLRDMATEKISVASMTTSSPQAYKHYHLGLEKFGSELFDQAREEFSKAIAIDSTFALPYLRFGMSYVFQGRQQEGVPYFVKAKQFESKLPLRDRNLLDVYTDLWLNQKFGDAFTKLKVLVSNYPNDSEIKALYALFLVGLSKDTTGAIAILEEVLQSDPKFQFALTNMIQICKASEKYEQAIAYATKMKEYYPASPAGYRTLADLYFQESDFQRAATAYEEQITRFPDDDDAHASLIGTYLRLRDFAKADASLEKYREKYQDDPFRLQTYYGMKANLANWGGGFLTSLGYRHQALAEAYQTKDSLRITQSLEIISFYSDYYGFPDSALYYCRQIGEWATFFVRLNHPLQLVTYDRSLADSLRPVMRQMADEFRARVPAELMKIAENIEALFEAFAAADTTRIVSVFEGLLQAGGTSSSSRRNIGELCVLSGRCQKGKEYLEQYLRDPDTPVSGFWYPYGQYLLGIANEGLGNTKDAVKNYQEMLKYWNNPEIEIPAIKDARSRLARLRA